MASGTLLEYTNLKLFVIYHALVLESKREVFINEYKSVMVSMSKGLEAKLTYLTQILIVNIFSSMIKY